MAIYPKYRPYHADNTRDTCLTRHAATLAAPCRTRNTCHTLPHILTTLVAPQPTQDTILQVVLPAASRPARRTEPRDDARSVVPHPPAFDCLADNTLRCLTRRGAFAHVERDLR